MTPRRTLVVLAVLGFVLTASAGAAFAFFAIPTAYAPTNYSVATASSLVAPTAPSAAADSSSAITVGWTPASGQLAGAAYRVTRSTGPGSPTTVCTVTSSTCQDTGLTPGSLYGYSISAVLGAWQSPAVTTSASTSKASQTISFTSTAPSNATANGPTYTVTATATSGLTVTLTTDATSTGCSISGSTVSFTSAGTCTIDANQVGDSQHLAAPQVQQSFAVTAPSASAAGMIWTNVKVGSSSVTPTCTGTIGSTWSCTVSGGNNATVSANVTFANAAGTATAFSASQASTVNVTTTGKNGTTSTTSIAAGQTTSTGTVSAQKSGSNAASITVTFNGWTAVLTIS